MRQNEYDAMYRVEDTHFWYRGMQKISEMLLRKYLPHESGNMILDAGCGTGGAMQWLKPFGKVYGFDISDLAIQYCKKRGLKNVVVGTVESIPFAPKMFDIVVCLDVLYHKQVKNDRQSLKELCRVLKPGGLLVIRVPAYNWLHSYHDVAVHAKHRYSAGEVEKLLLESGFAVKQTTYANMLLFPLSLVMRIVDRMFPSHHETSDVKPIHPILNTLFYFPLWIESKLIRFISLPFGLSVVVIAGKTV